MELQAIHAGNSSDAAGVGFSVIQLLESPMLLTLANLSDFNELMGSPSRTWNSFFLICGG